MAPSSSMRLVISGSRLSIQPPIPNPRPSKSGGLAMAHRGKRKRSSFFLMKIRGQKKSASSAAEVGVVAGVKDAEAGAEVGGSVDEGMVAPIAIHLLMVDGAVGVVEHVGITTARIVPTKEIITMSVVIVGGVGLAADTREALTTGVIPMATNILLTIAVAGSTTASTEGATSITTTNTLQGIVNETSNATISLRRMTASTS